jgi:hypothetical protein
MNVFRYVRALKLFVLRTLQRISITRALFDSSVEHWRQALLWAFSNAVGSFMPIWGAFFLLRLHRIDFRFADFARHGEFALYAAAFLAPAVYQILRNMRREKFPLKAGSILLALAGILMTAFIYAGTNPQFGATPTNGGQLDEHYLMTVSGSLLSIAFLFSFLVMLIDNVTNDPDLGVSDRVNQAFLEAAVAIDVPKAILHVADIAEQSANAIPSNDDLRHQFDSQRAEREVE